MKISELRLSNCKVEETVSLNNRQGTQESTPTSPIRRRSFREVLCSSMSYKRLVRSLEGRQTMRMRKDLSLSLMSALKGGMKLLLSLIEAL